MHRLKKIVLCLVFLKIAIIFAFLFFSSNWIKTSNIKREEISFDIQVRPDITVARNGNEKINNSTFLTVFKDGLRGATETPHNRQRYDGNPTMKVSRKQLIQSNLPPILNYKERLKRNGEVERTDMRKWRKSTNGNKTTSVNILDVSIENKAACIFSFDDKILLEAKLNISKSYYLFYINLIINDIQGLSVENKDKLTHWQYVKKKENFLVQLPVDFDLLTYNLLIIDQEETVLNIPVAYNNINCSQNSSDQLKSVRIFLWNKLFDNNTDYYLCNRDFTKNNKREWLYYLTTIWVGYDLSCSRMSSTNGGIREFQLKKDHLPLVTPVFCFVLSLQFVWLFVLLDMKGNSQAFDTKTSNDITHISSCPVIPETDQKRWYAKKDRPYGLKRFFSKLLYGTCCSIHPTIRLLLLMYIFIFLPFGLYRTLGRKNILSKMYDNYMTVVRPSEPIFSSMCNSNDTKCTITLDIIYATVSPIIYIFVGFISHGVFLSNDSRLWCRKPKNEDSPTLFTKNGSLTERFTFRYHQFCRSCKFDFDENIYKQCRGKCRGNNNESFCKRLFCFIFTWLMSLIFCLFPILPFSCWTHKCIDDCSCTCCCTCSTIGKHKVYTFVLNCLCLFLPVPYMLCLRPIISTFTFLLRSLTFFAFVALPVRVHILRYTILVVTTVTYFSKYFHEIINMNTEILKYIFNREEKFCGMIEKIDQKMFDYVYERLVFVKKTLYFMFLKMIVVFMYLFITIETFLSNKDSLTGSDFKDILEFLLIIIGPYAISFFLKGNNENFLSDENKTEIKDRLREFKCLVKENDLNECMRKTTNIHVTVSNMENMPTSTSASSRSQLSRVTETTRLLPSNGESRSEETTFFSYLHKFLNGIYNCLSNCLSCSYFLK